MSVSEDSRRPARVVGGVLLVLVGAIFLLQNAGLVQAGRLSDWWPMLLVWIGLSRLLAPRRAHHVPSGIVVLTLGVALQLDRLGVIWLHMRDLWPLLLVLAGLALVAESLLHRRGRGTPWDGNPAGRGDLS